MSDCNLYFDKLELGKIINQKTDFFRVDGEFIKNELDWQEEGYPRIKEYYEMSKQANVLSEGMNLDKITKEENKFLDVINSSKWFVKSFQGKQEGISSPLFLSDGGIIYSFKN